MHYTMRGRPEATSERLPQFLPCVRQSLQVVTAWLSCWDRKVSLGCIVKRMPAEQRSPRLFEGGNQTTKRPPRHAKKKSKACRVYYRFFNTNSMIMETVTFDYLAADRVIILIRDHCLEYDFCSVQFRHQRIKWHHVGGSFSSCPNL